MNILQMDMNLLKVLYLLTSTGSSQKTADKLGISTSAVSHALARLREVLESLCSGGKGIARCRRCLPCRLKKR